MKSSSFIETNVHFAAVATLLLLAATPGCSDKETGGGGGTTTTATGGSGGAGGATTAGGTAGAGGTTTTSSAAVTCLPDAATTALFTLGASDLCAIAVLTSDGAIGYTQPTWGAHGGPLLVTQGPGDGEVTLDRWTPPSGASGKLTIESTTLAAKIPAGAFVGGEALDLGFRAGTAISYSGAFPDTAGELIIASGASTDERYPVNALFSMVVLPNASDAASGRIAYTGISTLGDATPGANALYAADDCAGSFLPNGEPACGMPIEVSAWGDASGPAVSDTLGDVFVVMTNFAGDQIGRAFAADAIAEGAPATTGDVLFTLNGFGQSLAALAPEATTPGIVAFQPSDSSTFEALDVLEIRYSVKDGKVTAESSPKPLLTFPAPNTAVAMLTDPEGHLWVGVPVQDGGKTTTTFVVLARKP
jgi:hypothetical protein